MEKIDPAAPAEPMIELVSPKLEKCVFPSFDNYCFSILAIFHFSAIMLATLLERFEKRKHFVL